MVSQQTAAEQTAGRRADLRFVVGAVGLLLVAAVGIYFVFQFVAEQRDRELRAWQVRLGIVADSRFAAVSQWLDRQQADLASLSENASLQLYFSQLVTAGSDEERQFLADTQGEFLRNLLLASAERMGFWQSPTGPEIPANVERVGVSGLALVLHDGQVTVATPGMPPIEAGLKDFVTGIEPGTRAIMDLYLNQAGRPAMAFAVPVYALQANPGPASDIGIVLGVKEVADELYPLLRQPGETAASAEAVLVRQHGAAIENLSPLTDGTPPLGKTLAADTPDLDAAFAIANSGGFALRIDERNRQVLVTARAFRDVPWTLLYRVERAEAMTEADARFVRVLTVFLLAIGAAALLVVALWRHASSRRTAEAAGRYQSLAERFEGQRNLLGLVTDNQPTSIFILDVNGRYRFANKEAGKQAGIAPEDMIGKPVTNVLGPEAAQRRLALNERSLALNRQVTEVTRGEKDGRVHVIQSEHIPVSAALGLPPGVLVVESDITEAVTERERRSRILDQLVRALVGVVDRRDPFAADHSAKVAAIAKATAIEMGLDQVEIDTAETAGRLLNLGKILVPTDMLTRAGELSDSERQKVREGLHASAELIEGIEFDGPVVETLRQALARWDGKGAPPGLAGEAILVTARIVAVANAFVGMVSARAHRGAMEIDRAVEIMLTDAGHAFDRRAVVALINYLDNRGGREAWAEQLKPAGA